MNQTLAIFLDAYRELNAKKLFWITLAVSALFIAGFALLGYNDQGLTILGFQMHTGFGGVIYKQVFSYVVVGFWLTWAAVILALVSTAGIFPDFIAGGSIDLYLAKPISRLRLFFTKYLAGLLFVVLQVALFAAGSFLVLGLRGGVWAPGLFWSVPIVAALFSYLFAVCVLIGVTTRSTIAALLLTVLCWLLFWAVHKAEATMLEIKVSEQAQLELNRRHIGQADAEIRRIETEPPEPELEEAAAPTEPEDGDDPAATTAPTTAPATVPTRTSREARLATWQFRRDRARQSIDEREPGLRKLAYAHRITLGVKTALPKTTETADLLDRYLFSDDDIAQLMEMQKSMLTGGGAVEGVSSDELDAAFEAKRETIRTTRERSIAWVVGTSLAFEAVVLALAAWRFCRRDY